MSQKNIVNIEVEYCPPSPTSPSSYKSQIYFAHRPFVSHHSLDVFTFPFPFISFMSIPFPSNLSHITLSPTSSRLLTQSTDLIRYIMDNIYVTTKILPFDYIRLYYHELIKRVTRTSQWVVSIVILKFFTIIN